MVETQSNETVNLLDYFLILRRRKWIIILTLVIILTTVIFHTFKTRPVFRSTTRIELANPKTNLFNLKDTNFTINTSSIELFNTQCEILKSRSLAERLAEEVTKQLNSNSKYRNLKSAFEQGYPTHHKKSLSVALSSNINVEVEKDTNIINISADSTNNKIAALIANSLVKVYKDWNRKNRQEAINESVDDLEYKINEQKKKVENAKIAIQKYMKENKIISLGTNKNIISENLIRVNTELNSAEAKLTNREPQLENYEKLYNTFNENFDSTDFLISLPKELAASELKKKYLEKEQDLKSLLETFDENHPKIILLASEKKEFKKLIKKEFDSFIQRARDEYNVAKRVRDNWKEELEKWERKLEEFNEKEIAMGLLEQEVETNKDLYNSLLEKYRELDVSKKGLGKSNIINIIDYAEPSSAPIKPNKTLSIFLATIVSLVTGCGLAFFLEYLDNSVKTQEDIEEYLNLPFLGVIPTIKTDGSSDFIKETIVSSEPKSMAAEAFRTVRTGISFSSKTDTLKTLLVTSGSPGEGKTLFSINLALTMAQSKSKILLIDADLRRPYIHKILKLKNSAGLSSYLSNNESLEQAVRKTKIPNLYAITSGPAASSPGELLESPRMRGLLEEAKKDFDKIIIDTPPVLTVADTLILAGIADGIIQIVKFGKSSRNVLVETKQRITNVNGNIVGVVLNHVDVEKSDYYYYPHYYYYHKYYHKK